MQAAVEQLVSLGPLPSSTKPDLARIEQLQSALEKVKEPVTDDEARVLVRLFGPDECFGLAWTLLHLIEAAPNWPLEDCLVPTGNEWIDLLRVRAENATAQRE